MQGYTETILKYASDTSHAGTLDNADGVGEVGLAQGEVGNRLAVRIALKMAGSSVAQVRFQVFGCGFTIAACAAAAELAEGQPVEAIRKLTPISIDRKLAGLPKERSYCANLAIEALQAAITSIDNKARPVVASISTAEEHGPRVDANYPAYRTLMLTPVPLGVSIEDRHLFACVITAALQDTRETALLASSLGLSEDNLMELLATYFPGITLAELEQQNRTSPPESEINREVLAILLSHVPTDVTGGHNQISEWLARILAARAAQPGHLWVAMGFFERPELTAAIRRHLPTLAAANNKGMRWKRYLFKQVCDMNGGVMCKNPNCGECSDYDLCFAPEDE